MIGRGCYGRPWFLAQAAHYLRTGTRLPDPSLAEQKAIMLRCAGKFFACRDGAEARRFNRQLIDAGYIKGL